MIVISILLYLIGFVIEKTRQYIFSFVYKTRIAKWWRKKYRGYLSELGFNINW